MGKLLFDRFGLKSLPSFSSVPGDDLLASVISEVQHILSVRAPFSTIETTRRPRRTVVDYGLADFLHLSPLGRQDAQKLAAYIYDAVSAYESRFFLEKVEVATPRATRDTLYATLTGYIRNENQADAPVSFSIGITDVGVKTLSENVGN